MSPGAFDRGDSSKVENSNRRRFVKFRSRVEQIASTQGVPPPGRRRRLAASPKQANQCRQND